MPIIKKWKFEMALLLLTIILSAVSVAVSSANGVVNQASIAGSTPTPTPTATPSPSPTPTVTPTSTPAPTGEVKEFAMTAKRFEFDPSRIEVNVGDTVVLKITGLDDGAGNGHGFALPDFGIDEVIRENQTVTIEFVANKTGTFTFYCSVYCGVGHSDMKGTLVVIDPSTLIPVIEVQELKREITIDPFGRVTVEDRYKITNRGIPEVSEVFVTLPPDVDKLMAEDAAGELGAYFSVDESPLYDIGVVKLRRVLIANETVTFNLMYELNTTKYISQRSLSDFNFRFDLIERTNLTIAKMTVDVILPDGAYLTGDLSEEIAYSTQNDLYLQKIRYNLHNFSGDSDRKIILDYHSSVFLTSLRPTLWMGIIAVLSAVILAKWRREPVISVGKRPPRALENFIKKYREKVRILTEMEALEEARKGKISKRRYRKRRRSLEARLVPIERELLEMKASILTEDPRFREVMRKIETVELELDVTSRDMERANYKLRLREISRESYEKLVKGFRRRREKAKRNIEELLDRLEKGRSRI